MPYALLPSASAQGYYFFFAIVNLGTLFFIWYTVPETKGRSLEEMDELFSREDLPGGPRLLHPNPWSQRTRSAPPPPLRR